MGYVLVNYPEDRTVFVDNTADGDTNEAFQVETGTHFFDLGHPVDYTPSQIKQSVPNNTSLNPLQLTFQRIEAPLAPAAPAAATPAKPTAAKPAAPKAAAKPAKASSKSSKKGGGKHK